MIKGKKISPRKCLWKIREDDFSSIYFFYDEIIAITSANFRFYEFYYLCFKYHEIFRKIIRKSLILRNFLSFILCNL